jgi:hypothetical protein
MIDRVANLSSGRVIVIEPRSLLVSTIVEYMNLLYPQSGISGCNDTLSFKDSDRIIYTTVQSFFLNPTLRTDDNTIFVVDEAHLDEPTYHTIINYFKMNPQSRVIFLTATPPITLQYPILKIPAVNQFLVNSVVVKRETFTNYLDEVVLFCNDRVPSEKILIFVPTIKMMSSLAVRVFNKSCLISSERKYIDPTASVYISTNVADAGLTIPDVDFVFSADLDIKVLSKFTNDLIGTNMSKINENSVNTFYFKISNNTITQRKGRTGRTSPGTFYLYRLSDEPISDFTYNLPDFMNNLCPAASVAVKYFPDNIKSQIPDGFSKTLPSWDLTPNRSWPLFINLLQSDDILQSVYNVSSEEFWKSFTVSKQEQGPRSDNSKFAFKDTDLSPFGDNDDQIAPLIPNERNINQSLSKPQSPPSSLTETETDPEVFSQQDVSGAGLLCGVRAVRGLVFSILGWNFSEGLYHNLFLKYLDDTYQEAVGEEPQNNFSFIVLRDILHDIFLIDVKFCLLDKTTNEFIKDIPIPNWVKPQEEKGVIFLLVSSSRMIDFLNHYNYLGVPIPDNEPTCDGEFDSVFPESSWLYDTSK